MATTKFPKAKDLKGYFFLSVGDGSVHTIYDNGNDEATLAAAFASAMMDDSELFDVISAAFLALLEEKEKYSSKIAKKPVKKATKSVKKK
jgi:hypothetical protein